MNECQGVEPAADESAAMEALAFTLSELKRCQDKREVRDCAKHLHRNMASNAAQHHRLCQGLEKLKMMSSIVQRQMCPDLDADYESSAEDLEGVKLISLKDFF